MISNLEIGHVYHLVGKDSWSSWNADVRVVAITAPSQIDRLGIDLYSTWFDAYGIDESSYNEMLNTMSSIYQCKILTSRKPIAETNDGDDLFTFNEMIDVNESEELVDCKSYSWVITSKPYTDDDENCPVNSELDISNAVTDAVKDVVFDAFSMFSATSEFYVAQSEYDTIVANRVAGKAKYKSDLKTKEDAYNTEMNNMALAITNANIEKTKYAAKVQELETKISTVENLKVSLNASITNYTAAATTLQLKYEDIRKIVDSYNNKSTTSASDKIILPDWDDLGL